MLKNLTNFSMVSVILTNCAFVHPVHWIISTFQMVAFFVISGVVTALGKQRGFFASVLRKVQTLLVPYFAWYLIGYFTQPSAQGFVEGLYNGGFWFLRVLFFVFVLHDFARALIGTCTCRLRTAGAVFLIAMFAYGLQSLNIPAFRQLGYFFIWFECAYYAMRYLNDHKNLADQLANRVLPILLVSVALFLSCAPFLLCFHFSYVPDLTMNRVAIVLMAIFGTLALLSTARFLPARIFVFTGAHSLAFYTLHCYIMSIAHRYFPITTSSPFRLTPSLASFINPTSYEFLLILVVFIATYLISALPIIIYTRAKSVVD